MANPINSNSALNLIMAARDVSAGPSSAGAPNAFSDMLERNMRQHDQAATRPRENSQPPARPTPAEPTRPAPTQGSGAKPPSSEARPTAEQESATSEAVAMAGSRSTIENPAADDPAAEAVAASLPQDDAALSAHPVEVADVLLTGNPITDPAENETAVAASLAVLAPVLAATAAPTEPDTSAPEAELPATPARTLASALMARLFGNQPTTGGEGGTPGPDMSGAGTAKHPNAATPNAADAKPDFAALVAGKQPAAAAATRAPAELNLGAGIDTAARIPNVAAQVAAEPGAAGLLHTAGVSGAGLARTESGPLPQLQVATAAGQRAWAEDVGTKLTWMVGRGESRAELVLTPPSLGKVGVSIHINGDQTTAHFIAATPAAREALEQAMPRLREIMQQSGINLGQTDVSTSSQHQAREDASPHRSPYPNGVASTTNRDDASLPLTSSTHWVRSGTGVIDTFA